MEFSVRFQIRRKTNSVIIKENTIRKPGKLKAILIITILLYTFYYSLTPGNNNEKEVPEPSLD